MKLDFEQSVAIFKIKSLNPLSLEYLPKQSQQTSLIKFGILHSFYSFFLNQNLVKNVHTGKQTSEVLGVE